MLYVGIDLGTYLCRFILAKDNSKSCKINSIEDRFSVVIYDTCVVNFGTMEPGKNIAKTTIYRIERVFEKFKNSLAKHANQPFQISCVATAALRFSPQSQEVIERIQNRFGIKIEVISSGREIYLSALGCQDQIKDHALVVDIGSGSTEIAYVTKKDDVIVVQDYISLDLGLINNGVEKQRRNDALHKLEKFAEKYHGLPIICSKCNTLKIAYNYFHKKRDSWVDGQRFNVSDLYKALQSFNRMNVQELRKMPSVGLKKTRLIKSGLPWVYLMIKSMRIDSLVLSEYGLKEGIILDMLSNDNSSNILDTQKHFEKANSNSLQSKKKLINIGKNHVLKRNFNIVKKENEEDVSGAVELKHINRHEKRTQKDRRYMRHKKNNSKGANTKNAK